MDVRCEPSRGPAGRGAAWKASISTWRLSGSSLSSQCIVDAQAGFGGELSAASRLRALFGSALGAGCRRPRRRRGRARASGSPARRARSRPSYGKSDQLQIQVGLHALAHVQQRLDGEQPLVASRRRRADRRAAPWLPSSRNRSARSTSASLRVSCGLSSPTARCLRAACRFRSRAAGWLSASRPCEVGVDEGQG